MSTVIQKEQKQNRPARGGVVDVCRSPQAGHSGRDGA